jgi:phage-related protein
MPIETFDFYYERAYTAGVQFNTLVDEVVSGNEQRRDMWTNPRRKWRLEFNANNVDTEAIVNFFIARKGRKEAFYWVWEATDPILNIDKGGDGGIYLVRFDTDELNFDHIAMGYTTFYIDLVQVFS